MSSSSHNRGNQSNNSNQRSYQHQYSDYESHDTMNPQSASDPTETNPVDDLGESAFQQMNPFHNEDEDIDEDEDLENEIAAEIDAHEQVQTNGNGNGNDEDETIFSDAVQDAFRKYQNEQEELFAQMEECWNYMVHENAVVDMPVQLVDRSQDSQLNPDAIEFQPAWLQPSSSSSFKGINTDCSVTVTSTASGDEKKAH